MFYAERFDTDEDRGKGFVAASRVPFITTDIRRPRRRRRLSRAAYWTDLEMLAGIGFTARLGFNAGEFLDYVAGWMGFDILRDDRLWWGESAVLRVGHREYRVELDAVEINHAERLLSAFQTGDIGLDEDARSVYWDWIDFTQPKLVDYRKSRGVYRMSFWIREDREMPGTVSVWFVLRNEQVRIIEVSIGEFK